MPSFVVSSSVCPCIRHAKTIHMKYEIWKCNNISICILCKLKCFHNKSDSFSFELASIPYLLARFHCAYKYDARHVAICRKNMIYLSCVRAECICRNSYQFVRYFSYLLFVHSPTARGRHFSGMLLTIQSEYSPFCVQTKKKTYTNKQK